MQQVVQTCVVVAAAGFLVACGEVQELPPTDEPVTVTVLTTLGDGAPDSTAKVLFQDPEGSVVSDSAVDAMGHAQAMLPRGGTVSAIRVTADPTNLAASITTMLDVKPGDDLTFGVKPYAVMINQGGQTTMTATFPPVPGATTYRFHTSCALSGIATASPVTLNFRDACHGAMFDLLATTTAGTPPVPMFLLVSNVAYQSGGSFSIPTLFNPMANFTINMTNAPDAVSSMSVSRTTLLNNTPTLSTSASVAGDPPAGDVSAVVPFPQGVGTRSELSITMGRDDATIVQHHEGHTAALSTSATVDLGQQNLPWFTNLTQTATGATWTMVAPGDPPDGMMVSWSGTWNDGTRPVAISWLVAQPAEMAGMTLPRLPAAYAMIDPGQQTVAVTPSAVTMYMADYDNLAGYDQLRQMPETLLTSPIGLMGAFVGMPFQRRIITTTVRTGP
jgi:hypothetical protein